MRSHVEMAKLFEGLVAMDKRFEIVVPRNFAMVCFRVSPKAMGMQKSNQSHQNSNSDNGHKVVEEEEGSSNEANQKLLESINMSGRAYMTHAMVGKVYAIRFAVGATLVEERHVIMHGLETGAGACNCHTMHQLTVSFGYLPDNIMIDQT